MTTRSLLALMLLLTACAPPSGGQRDSAGTTAEPELEESAEPALGGPIARGREIWFENTYGGEKFFAFLAAHPDPARRIRIAFDEVVNTPRAQRFAIWGTINDPDCVANPAGGPDLCADPNATGVVGIRQFPGPGGSTLYGAACAACHAGFDPLDPPCDPAEPSWDNIHPTIGNQHLRAGEVFAHNLPPTDPRRIMFAAWPDGTVDTSLLFNDGVMNPGTITAFWEQRHRPSFDVGLDAPKIRNGQGGEDDVGGELAAIRVYTNIGMCFQECIANRPDPSAPIDPVQCRADCPDFPPEQDLQDLVAFQRSIAAPRFPVGALGGFDGARFAQGRQVFAANCAGCHDDSGQQVKVLSNDEVNPLGPQATNACRAVTTNWDAGSIWANFSSDLYKGRGFKGYRTMPLAGIWATPPFLHNQSIGGYPAADADLPARAAVFADAMRELLSDDRVPRVNVLPVPLGPFPAGTPLAFVFSRDPATGAVLCSDTVENRGHTFGSELPDAEKEALIYFLLHQ